MRHAPLGIANCQDDLRQLKLTELGLGLELVVVPVLLLEFAQVLLEHADLVPSARVLRLAYISADDVHLLDHRVVRGVPASPACLGRVRLPPGQHLDNVRPAPQFHLQTHTQTGI